MKRKTRAEKIHEEAIIIDGLLYGPAADSDDYSEEVRRAGVTATNLTVPAVTDDYGQTKAKIDYWLSRIERNKDAMSLALSVPDIEQAKREGALSSWGFRTPSILMINLTMPTSSANCGQG